MSDWQHTRTFVELALSIDKHLPGYVDAYFGPEEIRENVDAKEKASLEELSTTLDQIADSTRQNTKISKERREYLSAELNAMSTTLKILRGEKIDIFEEAQMLYGLTPIWIEESVFEEAHRILSDVLPGSGPLAERMESFRKKTILPQERILPIVRNIADEFRHRSKKLFPLPENETCNYSVVQDKPWGAYNWYLGNYTSRVEINIDIPIRAGSILSLVAHEAYPGHHTEHAIKEKTLYGEGVNLEYSILLSNTPSAVVSEGIAEVALEMILTPEERAQFFQSILDQAELQEVDGDQIDQVNQSFAMLSKVTINKLLLLHSQGASEEDVIDYGMRYGLQNEGQSRKSLEFYKDPLWRSYGFLYPLGYDLVREFLSGGKSKFERFSKLLQEPITVSQLTS